MAKVLAVLAGMQVHYTVWMPHFRIRWAKNRQIFSFD